MQFTLQKFRVILMYVVVLEKNICICGQTIKKEVEHRVSAYDDFRGASLDEST